MPVYEFECSKGHVIEELVPVGTKEVACPMCSKPFAVHARRILSPTRTTFEFADNRRHKDWDKTP